MNRLTALLAATAVTAIATVAEPVLAQSTRVPAQVPGATATGTSTAQPLNLPTLGVPVPGQPPAQLAPPQSVDLATVLELAKGANPRLAVEGQNIAMAQADRMTAGAWPNPTVSMNGSYQPGDLTNFSSQRAYEGTLEMPLLLGGQRGARIRAADQGINAAQTRFAATGNDLAADAGAAFINLLVAQEKRDLQARNMVELERLRKIVAGRRASGVASEYDLTRIDVQLENWRTDLSEANADVAQAQADLAGQLGYADWRPRAVGQLSPEMIRVGTGTESPAVIAARQEQLQADAAVEVARRERFPAVSLNAGRFWTTNPHGVTYGIGVAVEIPIFDDRKGAQRRAEAEAAAAAGKRQLAEAQSRTDLDRLNEQLQLRRVAWDRFQQHVEPRIPTLRKMAEDAYRLSGGSVIELLDATRTLFDTEVNRAELIGKLAESQLRLQAAKGLVLPGEAR